jgi:2-dehydro-3-deoxyphosphogluconate aldolase/(4S)-4-hydroxy-2-oxoglutarate aldolase
MKNKEVRARIQELGVIPSIRVSSAEDARFAAEAVSLGGISIVEIAMTVPGASRVISDLVKHAPEMIVGAGGVLDKETARRCLDAGAQFLTTDALDLEVIELAVKEGVTVFPGALTPTEVLNAWKAGSDFVKVVPCGAVGGDSYIRLLKASFPQISLIAAGGVNQRTAGGFILAGADAVGVGGDLIPWEAIALRQTNRIGELSRRFLNSVATARREAAVRDGALSKPSETKAEAIVDIERPVAVPGDYL